MATQSRSNLFLTTLALGLVSALVACNGSNQGKTNNQGITPYKAPVGSERIRAKLGTQAQLEGLKKGLIDADRLFVSFWRIYWQDGSSQSVMTPFRKTKEILTLLEDKGELKELFEDCSKNEVFKLEKRLSQNETSSPTPKPGEREDQRRKRPLGPGSSENFSSAKNQKYKSLLIRRAESCQSQDASETIEIEWRSENQVVLTWNRENLKEGFGRWAFMHDKKSVCDLKLTSQGRLVSMICSKLSQDHNGTEFLDLDQLSYDRNGDPVFAATGSRFSAPMQKSCEGDKSLPCVNVRYRKGDKMIEIFENLISEEDRARLEKEKRGLGSPTPTPTASPTLSPAPKPSLPADPNREEGFGTEEAAAAQPANREAVYGEHQVDAQGQLVPVETNGFQR